MNFLLFFFFIMGCTSVIVFTLAFSIETKFRESILAHILPGKKILFRSDYDGKTYKRIVRYDMIEKNNIVVFDGDVFKLSPDGTAHGVRSSLYGGRWCYLNGTTDVIPKQ